MTKKASTGSKKGGAHQPTPARSNKKPPKEKASPSPTPDAMGPVPDEKKPKDKPAEKTVGKDAEHSAKEDTAADGQPRTVAGATAVIHPAPHRGEVKHLPGEEPDPDAKPDPNPEATIHGLRMRGRLYEARHRGLDSFMVEADSVEDAREAARVEYEAREKRQAKKKAETPAKVQLVDPEPQRPEFRPDVVRVKKLPA